jgi:hypothetical protein
LKFTSVEHKKRLSFFSATPIAENTALLVGSAVEGDASRRVKQRFRPGNLVRRLAAQLTPVTELRVPRCAETGNGPDVALPVSPSSNDLCAGKPHDGSRISEVPEQTSTYLAQNISLSATMSGEIMHNFFAMCSSQTITLEL